jgi:hypothetical protein
MILNDKSSNFSDKILICTFCDYKTNKNFNYNKHLCTPKHIKNMNSLQKVAKSSNENKYKCDCGNNYKYRQGLFNHKKNCSSKDPVSFLGINKKENGTIFILELIKQNQEFKELLLKQNKDHNELINKFIEREPTNVINTTNNNTTNQSFNLNVFLNETCKDAMNVKEFLENLNPTLDDLENVGEKGFVKGISDIILKSLREMEINKRPIHCTDIKREVVYLKEDDTWNKDDKDNSKMKELIRKVENKNFNNIIEWQRNHPDVRILDSADYIKQNMLMEKSCEAVNNEDRVRGKVLKELLKDIHINSK